ncbi:hypothetical protein F4558_003030 [Micromonospora profundi]|uniref:DUF2625 family protein n=1 Tax=Micromonospora TaxID=1873 RepID=UPI0016A4F039|nr:DUF2625 family protein [Micromonospora profundi]NJC13204.1 hypothetical protein [Micromonospora profundi]
MRPLIELVESDDPAWPEVEAAAAAAPYPVEVLAADARQADAELLRLQVTSRSWLGAVVHRSGGLVIDHGWLRVLGSGNKQRRLASLGEINEGIGGGIVVAQDVLGGQFAWVAPAEATPTIRYFAPDTLRWEDCEIGYGQWLAAMLGGGVTGFYEEVRWSGWTDEVAACGLDQAIHTWPPPWTREGKDLSTVSRRPVPMSEMLAQISDG